MIGDKSSRFPNKIVLVDTGQRRYPAIGEYYYWYDVRNGGGSGPFINDDYGDGWTGEPVHYAIYVLEHQP